MSWDLRYHVPSLGFRHDRLGMIDLGVRRECWHLIGNMSPEADEGALFAAPAPEPEVRPFLRWAGGKRWLIPQLPKMLGPVVFRRFHEPFLGGGSGFLGMALGKPSYLSDLNAELIEVYEQVREDPESIIRNLKRHKNSEEYYYKLRGTNCRMPATRAARFIFLNHTSYNGIFRVNSQTGKYNVPYGRRESPQMPTLEDLMAVSKRLQDAKLFVGDFDDCAANIAAGDLVFLDPPYTVAHNANGFVKYNQKLFSWSDQQRLSELIDHIRSKNAYYILTNAAHVSVRQLFGKGDRCVETFRRNSIGGSLAARGRATELLFTNVGTVV